MQNETATIFPRSTGASANSSHHLHIQFITSNSIEYSRMIGSLKSAKLLVEGHIHVLDANGGAAKELKEGGGFPVQTLRNCQWGDMSVQFPMVRR